MSKRKGLTLWEPHRELERLIDSLFRGFSDFPKLFELPHLGKGYGQDDVKETSESYIITVPLPGAEKDGIKVSLEDGVLTIDANGSYKKEGQKEEGGVAYTERSSGSAAYHRQWKLPGGFGEITSTYKNGVLEVTIPRPPEEKREPRYIEIKTE